MIEVLNCGVDDLSLINVCSNSLSLELNQQCADLISDTIIVELLTPSGNLKLADSLIQLSLRSNLALIYLKAYLAS